jgi:hypothetical protein
VKGNGHVQTAACIHWSKHQVSNGFYSGTLPWTELFSRYVNDFTKALASEVRILLAEVGKLRDERRQLQ